MSAIRLLAATFGMLAGFTASALAQTPAPDLVYSRVKPCRIFDTSKTQKIPANSAKSFQISGAGDYAAQGGTAAGCGVPASAQAVTLNITAINGAAAGSLTAMAYAQTSASTTIRYPVSAPETGGGVVDVLQNKITLRTTNTVNAIGDVTGYYAPQLRARVNSNGTLSNNAPGVISSSKIAVGTYALYFDRNVAACAGFAQSRSYINTGVDVFNGNYIYVYMRDAGDGSAIDDSAYVFLAC